MPRTRKDPTREERITMEIIVDAYGPEEQALGWYYYLKDNLSVPFEARCIDQRAISPLRKGDAVQVVGMPPEDECTHEMFVNIRWEKQPLAVPLSQLEPIPSTDDVTQEAVADWHYWAKQGYQLC